MVVFSKHQQMCKGDMSFMDKLLPKDYVIQHVDSYNDGVRVRFQGCFGMQYKDMVIPIDNAPLAILKLANKYQTHLCTQCGKNPHIVWTIWFEETAIL